MKVNGPSRWQKDAPARSAAGWSGMLSDAQERNDKNFLSIPPDFTEHFDPFIQFERTCMTPFAVQPPFKGKAVARVA